MISRGRWKTSTPGDPRVRPNRPRTATHAGRAATGGFAPVPALPFFPWDSGRASVVPPPSIPAQSRIWPVVPVYTWTVVRQSRHLPVTSLAHACVELWGRSVNQLIRCGVASMRSRQLVEWHKCVGVQIHQQCGAPLRTYSFTRSLTCVMHRLRSCGIDRQPKRVRPCVCRSAIVRMSTCVGVPRCAEAVRACGREWRHEPRLLPGGSDRFTRTVELRRNTLPHPCVCARASRGARRTPRHRGTAGRAPASARVRHWSREHDCRGGAGAPGASSICRARHRTGPRVEHAAATPRPSSPGAAFRAAIQPGSAPQHIRSRQGRGGVSRASSISRPRPPWNCFCQWPNNHQSTALEGGARFRAVVVAGVPLEKLLPGRSRRIPP